MLQGSSSSICKIINETLILTFLSENCSKTAECCLRLDQNEPDCLQRKQNQSHVDECSTNSQDIRCEMLSLEHLEGM